MARTVVVGAFKRKNEVVPKTVGAARVRQDFLLLAGERPLDRRRPFDQEREVVVRLPLLQQDRPRLGPRLDQGGKERPPRFVINVRQQRRGQESFRGL